MVDAKAVRDFLCCPRCKKRLTWGTSSQTCESCGGIYATDEATIPVYRMFIDDSTQEPGRDPAHTWDKASFEKVYELTGYHEASTGFDKSQGYPAEVSEFIFRRVKGRLLDWVRPGPNQRVLDIGCGAGYFLHLLRQRYVEQGFAPTVVGTDISELQLSYAVQRMQKEHTEMIAVHGNGEYLPFAENSFDLVTCSEVLEHIRNPVRALREMRRIVKPDGLILLSTCSMQAEKAWGKVLAVITAPVKMVRRYKYVPAFPPGYEIPWYPKEFKDALQEAGLNVEEFEFKAIIPVPWYFRFLPRLLVKPVVFGCEVVDRLFGRLLRPLALHFVVRATKGTQEADVAYASLSDGIKDANRCEMNGPC